MENRARLPRQSHHKSQGCLRLPHKSPMFCAGPANESEWRKMHSHIGVAVNWMLVRSICFSGLFIDSFLHRFPLAIGRVACVIYADRRCCCAVCQHIHFLTLFYFAALRPYYFSIARRCDDAIGEHLPICCSTYLLRFVDCGCRYICFALFLYFIRKITFDSFIFSGFPDVSGAKQHYT